MVMHRHDTIAHALYWDRSMETELGIYHGMLVHIISKAKASVEALAVATKRGVLFGSDIWHVLRS